MNPTRKVLEEAQAMQKRFAEQTANQILVCNRLTAQRSALSDLAYELIEHLEDIGSDTVDTFRARYNAALEEDPEEKDGMANSGD